MNDFSTSRTIYLLKRTEIMLRSMLEDALKGLPVTVGQYVILSLLKYMPKASSAELSRKSGVTPQTMSETITIFEDRGYILRKQSSEHKRILEISLTPTGRKLLEECEAMVDKVEDKLFAGMAKDNVDQLRSTLKAVLRAGEARPDHDSQGAR
jgi:DNA-binding MarR family transcriptional regulator